jgi:hypothetical protein
MGAMYEGHLHSGFRDLLDSNSAEWASSDVALKVIHLKAFDAAGVPLAEIIEHYRETLAQAEPGHTTDSLPATVKLYREAGYWPPVPEDIDAATDAQA